MRHIRYSIVLAVLLIPARAQAQAPDSLPTGPWWQRVSFGADMRVRAETFHQQDAPDRFRGRLRLRAAAGAQIDRDVDVGVRLVTGSPFDPITANQTFTSWYTRKPITLDRAFVVYHPAAVPGLRLGAGKFEFPLRITNMVFDDNLNWEGAFEQFGSVPRSGFNWKVTAVQAPMNERSHDSDSFLFVESGQLSHSWEAGFLGVTLSSLKYTNPDPLAIDIANETVDARATNLLSRNGSGEVTGYASDFNVVDVVFDAVIPTARAAYPIALTVDVAKNFDAVTSEDAGLWIETQYGLADAPHTYSIGYTFARVEQDAVLAPFLFDDMLGTNAVMHVAAFSYVPIPKINIDVTVLFNKWLKPLPSDNPNTLTRVQLSARAHL